MNEHGRHAMEKMKNHDPASFAQITDPETYFATLGREIQDRIWALLEDLIPRVREIAYQETIHVKLPRETEEIEPVLS
jgi:hypothetical protein